MSEEENMEEVTKEQEEFLEHSEQEGNEGEGEEQEGEEDFVEENEDYEYIYSDNENNNDNDDDNNNLTISGLKRPLDLIENTHSIKKKYLDADSCDLRTWAEGNVIKIAIVGTIRQIVEHQSNNFRIFCSSEQLENNSLEWLITTILCEITTNMTIVYELKFSTLNEMGKCAPALKCLTYCGLGTYFFPDCLLPNRFSKFVDFGKLFYDITQQLIPYQSKMIPFYSITPVSAPYLIQELSYLTQYNTRTLFHLSECGVVTGIERNSNIDNNNNTTSKSNKRGVGYSTGHATELKKENTYLNQIISYFNQLIELCPETLTPTIPNILESPLNELLSQMILESSIEELTRNPTFATAILTLMGKLENLYSTIKFSSNHNILTGSENNSSNASSSSSPPSFNYYFTYETYSKIAKFQEIVESDPTFGFGMIQIPPELTKSSTTSSSATINDDNLKSNSSDTVVDLSESVIFVESFRAHIYANSTQQNSNYTSSAFLRRMRIEFTTLSTALPPTIKITVLESNYAFSKFLIVGPDDTPYEGGFFLFDMKLPADYPNTSPSVTFLTTGGGAVRFNPNLYNNGKVCLSLLGTWEGERWNPAISNINQVLQSICYLIFVPEPYYNEPGYDGRQGHPDVDRASKQYTENIRQYTLQHAILDHLVSPDNEFGDIIKQMLRNNWSKMKQTYLKWCDELDGVTLNTNSSSTSNATNTNTNTATSTFAAAFGGSSTKKHKSSTLRQLIEKIESKM